MTNPLPWGPTVVNRLQAPTHITIEYHRVPEYVLDVRMVYSAPQPVLFVHDHSITVFTASNTNLDAPARRDDIYPTSHQLFPFTVRFTVQARV